MLVWLRRFPVKWSALAREDGREESGKDGRKEGRKEERRERVGVVAAFSRSVVFLLRLERVEGRKGMEATVSLLVWLQRVFLFGGGFALAQAFACVDACCSRGEAGASRACIINRKTHQELMYASCAWTLSSSLESRPDR